MKQGYLSQYFDGVAAKRLSAVETDLGRSHQHEFNGSVDMRRLFGEPVGKVSFPAKFVYFSDELEGMAVSAEGSLTWYDARERARVERGIMRWEYRLYFPPVAPLEDCASEGDLLLIAKRPDGSALVIVVKKESTIERQFLWLFGVSNLSNSSFHIRSDLNIEEDRVSLGKREILEYLGIEVNEVEPNYLDDMLERFGGKFPKTDLFSHYARNTLGETSSLDDPDLALALWMEREEVLFRTLENHLLKAEFIKLSRGGFEQIDPFFSLFQSAQQRRRARAGSALENHLEQIFREHSISYTRGGLTEKKLKPDFIFPSITHYHNQEFPSASLTMLAVKSTCKDRWRQILNEAERIPTKHLLTLEPGISENQTDEIHAEQVQLVLPRSLHSSFTAKQQSWLMRVADFVNLARSRQ